MRHLLGVERRLPVDVRVAAGLEQPIAVAQRNVQRLREDQHRLTARLRSSRFDEADMSAEKPARIAQIELADAACGSPLPEQVTDGVRYLSVFVQTDTQDVACICRSCYGGECRAAITSDVIATDRRSGDTSSIGRSRCPYPHSTISARSQRTSTASKSRTRSGIMTTATARSTPTFECAAARYLSEARRLEHRRRDGDHRSGAAAADRLERRQVDRVVGVRPEDQTTRLHLLPGRG